MDEADELRRAVRALSWVHTIDLGHGIVTPGAWPPSPLIAKALEGIDFRGKSVLDIGCWDGLWSFEAERRGAAAVYATDYTAHRPHRELPTFALASRALNSRAHYVPDLSVYDVARLGVADFDIVLFCGVYYHLKDPLLALARLRQVMRTGGLIVVEGEVIDDECNNFAQFHYRQPYAGDRSTWWVPTVACLREWVACSAFEILHEFNVSRDSMSGHRGEALRKRLKRWFGRRGGLSRCAIVARAVCRADGNYPYPDEELGRFQVETGPSGPTDLI